jgi:hypothetical protein
MNIRFTDTNNEGLLGGRVYTYCCEDKNLKATYTDKTMITPNCNPIVLDSNGGAQIYLKGTYYVEVFDSEGVLRTQYRELADFYSHGVCAIEVPHN